MGLTREISLLTSEKGLDDLHRITYDHLVGIDHLKVFLEGTLLGSKVDKPSKILVKTSNTVE